MATKRTSRAAEEKRNALQNELEILQYELDANELEQDELRGVAESLIERIEVLEDQLEEGYTEANDEE